MKDKILSVLIILAVIGGALYFFFDKNNYEGNSIVDVDVESNTLNSYYIGNGYISELEYENEDILDIIDQTDASYFTVKVLPDFTMELSQHPKVDYEEIKDNNTLGNIDEKGIDITRDTLLKLFNMKYTDVGEVNEDYTVYNSALIDDIFKGYGFYNVYEDFKSHFDGEVDDVIYDNKVVLSCEDVQFTKIGLIYPSEDYDWEEQYDGTYLYLIGNATVYVKTSDYEETKDVDIKTLVKVIEDKSAYVSFQTLKFQ